MMLLDGEVLRPLLAEILREQDVQEPASAHVAESLVQTSLRGVDSHGINLFPHYLRAVRAGRVKAQPNHTWEIPGPAVTLLDADHGFGHSAGAIAMDRAIRQAKSCGVGTVSVRNSTHFGAAAFFGLRAAEAGCLGFAFTNADALVKAFGAKKAFFGTNPICFTAPLANEAPLCLDMATSQVSWNKILNYRGQAMDLEPGWAFDRRGEPVIDSQEAASLSAIGAYKGFGLGMMVEIICSLLAGGPVGADIPGMYHPPLDEYKRRISHFFMAIEIERFLPRGQFEIRLQDLVDRLRSLEPSPGGAPVMVPGDPEKHCEKKRVLEGIPVTPDKFQEFLAVSCRFEKALKS